MNYWYNYYHNPNIVDTGNQQKNVGRTQAGSVISEKNWKKTIDYLCENIQITKDSSILEICCGNGAVIGELSKKSKFAKGIDYSSILLQQLKSSYPDVYVEESDILKYDPKNNECYNIIICYFALQHFTEKECIHLIEKYDSLLENGGIFFIGDIPNRQKLWDYTLEPSHKKDYIQRIRNGNPLIGNWYDCNFFEACNYVYDHLRFEVLQQPSYQINSHYRFDVKITKV